MEHIDADTYPDYDSLGGSIGCVRDHYMSLLTGNTYSYEEHTIGDGEFHLRPAFFHCAEKYRKIRKALPNDEYPYTVWLRVVSPSLPDLDGKFVLRSPRVDIK